MERPILKASNIKTWFPIRGGFWNKVISHVKAVDGVSLEIKEGEIYSLVGESGSGKSTLGYSLLGLTQSVEGKLWLSGSEINMKVLKNWASFRKDFQIIYQSSYSSLNPRNTIFEMLSQPLKYYGLSKGEIEERVVSTLEEVGLSADMRNRFPHAFSGGQRQRINIARSLCLRPRFIVCDEVVSALDVQVQSKILDLLLRLRAEYNLSLLFITHDMGVVRDISDRVGVMYQGKLVEEGSVKSVLENPQKAYTQRLLSSVPSLDLTQRKRNVATRSE